MKGLFEESNSISQIRFTSQCLKVESYFCTQRSLRKLVKMIENCIEEGIGLEKPGIAWKSADVRDDQPTLKYLYGLGNVFF
jgi:hypothetical protein